MNIFFLFCVYSQLFHNKPFEKAKKRRWPLYNNCHSNNCLPVCLPVSLADSHILIYGCCYSTLAFSTKTTVLLLLQQKTQTPMALTTRRHVTAFHTNEQINQYYPSSKWRWIKSTTKWLNISFLFSFINHWSKSITMIFFHNNKLTN